MVLCYGLSEKDSPSSKLPIGKNRSEDIRLRSVQILGKVIGLYDCCVWVLSKFKNRPINSDFIGLKILGIIYW